ncbi:MAG: copper homeostasis protein CutC [Acidobacteriales bacterium]|nr:copper homeostasis protein CutC [Terriglobales bacterium]
MPDRKRILLEICAYSVEAAIIAQSSGADRVELCANRSVHGTTPAANDIQRARTELSIPLHAMVRPRGGDFVYSDAEFGAMKETILECRKVGVDGVVLGMLLPTGDIDMKRCRELVELARPMSVTFHRAFDVTRNSTKALEEIIKIGCERLLTSGHESSATEGSAMIAQLVKQAEQRIFIMPGAGVRADNLAELIRRTSATEFHSSACLHGDLPNADEIRCMLKIVDELSKS